MTDKIQEQISALVDDEIHDTELKTVIAELTRNRASAEQWQRYHLISDALHNNLPDTVEPDLARRVQQALEKEPTVLAPQRVRIPAKVLPALKQVGGMAVAASVAVVMVVSLQNEQSGFDAGQQTAQVETATPAAVVADAEKITPSIQRPVTAVSSRPALVSDIEYPQQPVAVSPQTFDPRFESYLIDHSEYAVTGMLPYTRVTGTASGTLQHASGE